MTYFIVLILIGINILFLLYNPKKLDEIRKEITYNKIKVLKKDLIILNVLTIGANLIYIIISLITGDGNSNLLVDIVSVVGEVVTLALVLISKSYKTNYILKARRSRMSMVLGLLLVMIIVGDRQVTNNNITPIILIVCFILGIVLTAKDVLISFKIKDKVIKSNIEYFTIVAFLVMVLIYINIPFSYVAFVILSVLLVLVYLNKIKKISTEKSKLKKIIEINEKPGNEYILEFYKDLMNTEELIQYVLVFIVALVLNIVININYIYISMYLILVVVNIRMSSYKRQLKMHQGIEKEQSKRYQPLDNIKFNTIDQNELLLLNEDFLKVYYIKDNLIYMSEIILYNVQENELDNIKLYINTSNNNDYVFMVGDLYE